MPRGRYAREYSLLQNTRTPASVLASQATTRLFGAIADDADGAVEDRATAGTAVGVAEYVDAPTSPAAAMSAADDDNNGAESGAEKTIGHASGGGAVELRRLHTEFASVSILTIRGLTHVDELYRNGVLDNRHAQRLEREFHTVGGSWCCANKRDLAKHQPNNHAFRLPLLPSEGVRLAGSTQEQPAGRGSGGLLAKLFGGA